MHIHSPVANLRCHPDAIGDAGEGQHDGENDGGDDEHYGEDADAELIVVASVLPDVRESIFLVQHQRELSEAHGYVVVVGQVFPEIRGLSYMTSTVDGGGGSPKSGQKEQNQLIFDSDRDGGKKYGRHIRKPLSRKSYINAI